MTEILTKYKGIIHKKCQRITFRLFLKTFPIGIAPFNYSQSVKYFSKKCELCNFKQELCNTFTTLASDLCNRTFSNKPKMKKPLFIIAFLCLLLILLFASCGPSKALMVSQTKVETLQKEIANTRTQLKECNTKVDNMFQDKAALQTQNALVQDDLKDINTESEMTIANQAKRLKNLQEMINSQKSIMTNLQNTIAEALMNYSADELSVYIKDGNVYVSLAEKLLYKSGSDVVDPKGKEALASLAKVLNSTKDIRVLIEGHTDSIPMRSKQFEDNWELSTARANSIVRILTSDFGFDSNRITASGRSQFHPVKSNDTPEGRAANRRTEVILSPDLKELYTILYQ